MVTQSRPDFDRILWGALKNYRPFKKKLEIWFIFFAFGGKYT